MDRMEELAAELEPLVDRGGIGDLLEALAALVDAKADFIDSNWQDQALARAWRRVGMKVGLAAQIARMERI